MRPEQRQGFQRGEHSRRKGKSFFQERKTLRERVGHRTCNKDSLLTHSYTYRPFQTIKGLLFDFCNLQTSTFSRLDLSTDLKMRLEDSPPFTKEEESENQDGERC